MILAGSIPLPPRIIRTNIPSPQRKAGSAPALRYVFSRLTKRINSMKTLHPAAFAALAAVLLCACPRPNGHRRTARRNATPRWGRGIAWTAERPAPPAAGTKQIDYFPYILYFIIYTISPGAGFPRRALATGGRFHTVSGFTNGKSTSKPPSRI